MDGVSLTVSNLARCLYQQGKDVTVITPEMPGIDEAQLPYSTIRFLCRDAGLTDINI